MPSNVNDVSISATSVLQDSQIEYHGTSGIPILSVSATRNLMCESDLYCEVQNFDNFSITVSTNGVESGWKVTVVWFY